MVNGYGYASGHRGYGCDCENGYHASDCLGRVPIGMRLFLAQKGRERTLSPILIFAIGTKALSVCTSVPATNPELFIFIPTVFIYCSMTGLLFMYPNR